MQAVEAANAKPRLLVRVTGGLVDIYASDGLELTVVYDDLEIRCDNVYHHCSPDELDELIRRTNSYRFNPLFAKQMGDG
jgi:hypothetical protein